MPQSSFRTLQAGSSRSEEGAHGLVLRVVHQEGENISLNTEELITLETLS